LTRYIRAVARGEGLVAIKNSDSKHALVFKLEIASLLTVII